VLQSELLSEVVTEVFLVSDVCVCVRVNHFSQSLTNMLALLRYGTTLNVQCLSICLKVSYALLEGLLVEGHLCSHAAELSAS
jgi:hypothetical protein